jgi:hypothetical protein
MTELDLTPSFRQQIEYKLGRPLTDDELRVVASYEELTEAHRDVIRRIGEGPLSMAYLVAAIPRIREPSKKLDEIVNGWKWKPFRDPPPAPASPRSPSTWSHLSGLGRWRFRIQPEPGESPLETVRRCVDIIVANARPFGHVEAVPSYVPPAELVLHVFVETEAGPAVLPSMAGITFAIVDGTVELVLLLDVDIHAFVTHQYIDNAALAAVNAPRLAQFLAVLHEQLHAELVESNGLLPADETGFTAR